MRFVQISDVHLGASMDSSALGLPPAKRDLRRRELMAALRRTCDLARDEGADVILLPGDLFDHEGVARDTLAEGATILGDCGIPVVLAPGNHDFYSPSSYYNADFIQRLHGLRWPANVHLFSEGSWTRLQVPGIPDAVFTGIAFTGHDGPDDRPLAQAPPPAPGASNMLVFHGSRLGHAPPGKRAVLPFSDAELQAAGYDYAALGHYHSHGQIRDAAGRLLGAYSGCPAGRGLDECGPKGVLVGELGKGGARVDLVPVDGRVIHDIDVDCTGAGFNAALLQRIEEAVRGRGCRNRDIVYVRVTGRIGRGIDPTIPDGFLADRCFHLAVNTVGLAPDHDLERYRDGPGAETTEGRFVAAIERRLAAATEAEEEATLQRALYYGLDALSGGEVVPRYEPVRPA